MIWLKQMMGIFSDQTGLQDPCDGVCKNISKHYTEFAVIYLPSLPHPSEGQSLSCSCHVFVSSSQTRVSHVWLRQVPQQQWSFTYLYLQFPLIKLEQGLPGDARLHSKRKHYKDCHSLTVTFIRLLILFRIAITLSLSLVRSP